jgi:hypothetical protein
MQLALEMAGRVAPCVALLFPPAALAPNRQLTLVGTIPLGQEAASAIAELLEPELAVCCADLAVNDLAAEHASALF